MASLAASAASDAKARAQEDLARVQEALAATEEGKCKGEAETAHLKVEQTSLLLELGATKDEVSSLHSQAGRDKEAMEEEYQKPLEVIFAYGYGCCVFKHNISGDHPEVPDSMPDSADPLPSEFFANPGCPPIQAAAKATGTETPPSKTAKEPMEVSVAVDQRKLLPLFFHSYFVIFLFVKGPCSAAIICVLSGRHWRCNEIHLFCLLLLLLIFISHPDAISALIISSLLKPLILFIM